MKVLASKSQVIQSKGMKRIVDEDEIGSTALRTKSELLHEEDKHDLVCLETITMPMAVSNLWASLPRAITSPGLELSPRR